MADALDIVPTRRYLCCHRRAVHARSTRSTSSSPRPAGRPRCIAAAERFVMIPDLFNYWLTGEVCCEYTDASTTQLMNPRTRTWAVDLMERLNLPARLAAPIVEAGSIIGPIRADVAARQCAGRHARHRVGLARHGICRRGDYGARRHRVHQLRHLVARRHRARRAGPDATRDAAEFLERGGRRGYHAIAEERDGPLAAAGMPAIVGAAGSPVHVWRADGRGRAGAGVPPPCRSGRCVVREPRRHAGRDRSFSAGEPISQLRPRPGATRAPSSTAWR